MIYDSFFFSSLAFCKSDRYYCLFNRIAFKFSKGSLMAEYSEIGNSLGNSVCLLLFCFCTQVFVEFISVF